MGGGGVVATAGAVLAAECVAAGEVAGADVEGGPDAGDEPAAVAKAVPEAGADAALDEGDPPPHAVRPTPPITAAAMITTGTRRILMPIPFIELPDVTAGDNNGFVVTILAGRRHRRRLNQKKSTFVADPPTPEHGPAACSSRSHRVLARWASSSPHLGARRASWSTRPVRSQIYSPDLACRSRCLPEMSESTGMIEQEDEKNDQALMIIGPGAGS